ncbi:GntR family transcriptional regulator [Ancylobacter defluvii]|uniref:GntR family transcriptional regulator n=2 Tax=Ancylobacter defluvii TaxID=1282440 RepID=A0A9W6NCS0_9HYPH|nr:GntR family transcriptional regulator [Ancylobacter defluvii]GLK86829.1 GntR family transcriptional regulator [Ancylobacter defluvii]
MTDTMKINDAGPELTVVEREPVVLHVHRELRRAILRGSIPAGTRMIETQLSNRLAVSRTPVREAISRLESEGLVLRQVNGGVIVAEVDKKLGEILVIRQALEGAAVRLACANASDPELSQILRGCREAARQGAPDGQTRSAQDRAFHLSIARASGSTRLLSLIEEFYEYSFSAVGIDPTPEESARLQADHLEVASALIQRDSEDAERIIRKHFDEVLRIANAHIELAERGTQPSPR